MRLLAIPRTPVGRAQQGLHPNQVEEALAGLRRRHRAAEAFVAHGEGVTPLTAPLGRRGRRAGVRARDPDDRQLLVVESPETRIDLDPAGRVLARRSTGRTAGSGRAEDLVARLVDTARPSGRSSRSRASRTASGPVAKSRRGQGPVPRWRTPVPAGSPPRSALRRPCARSSRSTPAWRAPGSRPA